MSNKSTYTPLPIVTRVSGFGQLEQFYDGRVQKVLRKWSPRIPAEAILEVFRFLCRLTNFSRGMPPTRREKMLELYLREPRFFAELLWTLEQVTFSNREGSQINIPSNKATAGHLYRQLKTHDMGKMSATMGISKQAAAQALRNQRDDEKAIQAWWLARVAEESKARKTRKNVE